MKAGETHDKNAELEQCRTGNESGAIYKFEGNVKGSKKKIVLFCFIT